MKISSFKSIAIVSSFISAPLIAGEVATVVEQAPVEDPFVDRLLGNWGGARTSLLDHGITVDLDAWYHLQGVMDGGRGTGDDVGNLFSGRLGMKLDTGKAGLWEGGFFSVRLQARGGDGVLGEAGATSPVNNAVLLPAVPGRSRESAWALNELTYTQFLSTKFGVFGGLLNTDGGDSNPIGGTLGSNSHFMNTAFLFSSAVASTVPVATPGGGLIFIPNEHVIGSFSVFGTNETTGTNPFDNYGGTTFATEWTFKGDGIGGRPGGMTIGGTYGIDERLRLGEDPRIVLPDVVTGGSLATEKNAWSVYWNGFQYLQGDESNGWGLFSRLGFTDTDPSVIAMNAAVGIGGVGLIPTREHDRWGLGAYYQEFSDGRILDALGIDEEVGGELFYNVQVTPATNLTFDLQVIDSPLPNADTAVVGGVRFGVRF